MSIDEPQGSIEFAPTPIGGPRRRFDPTVIGVAVVVIGLVLAIAKPWDRPVAGDGATPSSSAAASVRPSSAPTSPAPSRHVDSPSIAGIAGAMQPHDAWGIRAIVEAPDDQERWVQVDGGAGSDRTGEIGSRDEPIAALGVTTPRTQTPLDVRVWRPTADGDLEWLDVRRIPPELVGGELLLWPPGSDGSQATTWPAGRYRIDLLMGTTIERVDVSIPGRFERIPVDVPPSVPTALAPAIGIVPAGQGMSGFVVADGVATDFAPVPGPTMDIATAWLRPSLRTGEGGYWTTPSLWEPRATGLGVRFSAGAHVIDATFVRLAPGSLAVDPVPVEGIVTDPAGSVPYVMFAAPDGRAWAPGVYAIRASWADANGPHAGDWSLELRPGRTNASSVLFEAARGFASWAGLSRPVVGTDVRLPVGFGGTSCDEVRDGADPTVLGISHPVATKVTDVTAKISLYSGRSWDVALRVVPEAVPGMTLVESASGGSLPAGLYRLTILGAAGPQRLTVCLGSVPFDG